MNLLPRNSKFEAGIDLFCFERVGKKMFNMGGIARKKERARSVLIILLHSN